MSELDALLARIADSDRHKWADSVESDRRDAYRMLPQVARQLRDQIHETQVRDDIADAVMGILRDATGRGDFHNIAEAAEHIAARLKELESALAVAQFQIAAKDEFPEARP